MLTQEESKRRADETRRDWHELAMVDAPADKPEVTCEKCEIDDTRPMAFDLYNTDGDCIVEK